MNVILHNISILIHIKNRTKESEIEKKNECFKHYANKYNT